MSKSKKIYRVHADIPANAIGHTDLTYHTIATIGNTLGLNGIKFRKLSYRRLKSGALRFYGEGEKVK